MQRGRLTAGGQRRITRWLFIVTVWAVLCVPRFAFLAYDAPEDLDWSWGELVDSGNYAVNARNRVITGRWTVDEWNLMYLTPVPHLVTYGVYCVFGVGYWQTQLVAALFSALSLWIVFLIVRTTIGQRWAVLAMVLMGVHYLYWTYARVANRTLELLCFLLLAVLFWVYGTRRPGFWMAAGGAIVLGYMTKSLTHPLMLALILTSIWWLYDTRELRRRSDWWPVLGLLFSMLVGFAIWAVWILLPHLDTFRMFFHWDWELRRPHGLAEVVRFFWKEPGTRYILWYMPVLGLVGALQILAIPLRWVRKEPLFPLERIAWTWFMLEFGTFALIRYRYLRFWIPALTALFLLGVVGLYRLAHRQGSWWSPAPVFLAWAVAWGIPWVKTGFHVLGPTLYDHTGWRFLLLDTHPYPWNYVFGYGLTLILTVLCVGIVTGGLRLWSRYRPKEQHRVRCDRLSRWAVIALVLTAVSVQFAWAVHWWTYGPTTRLRDFSRFLARYLPANSVLTGNMSPTLALETPFPVHPIYAPRKLNFYPGVMDRFGITHFVLVDLKDDKQQLFENFPHETAQAEMLVMFPLRNRRVELWARVPPPQPGLTVRAIEPEPDGGWTRIVVQNMDPYLAHEWTAPDGTVYRLEPLDRMIWRVRRLPPDLRVGARVPASETRGEFERCSREGGMPVWDPHASNRAAVAGFHRIGQVICAVSLDLHPGSYVVRMRVQNATPRTIRIRWQILDRAGHPRGTHEVEVLPRRAYHFLEWAWEQRAIGHPTLIWYNPGPGIDFDVWQLLHANARPAYPHPPIIQMESIPVNASPAGSFQ